MKSVNEIQTIRRIIMRSRILSGFLPFIATIAIAAPASALVTVTMTGTTKYSSIAGTDGNFTATMVYDYTENTVVNSGSGSGYNYQTYAPLQSASFQSGSVSFTVNLFSTDAAHDQYSVRNGGNSSNDDYISAYLKGATQNYIQAIFEGGYTTINTTELISPAAFAGSSKNQISVAPDANSSYSGTIQSFSVSSGPTASIPEPTTWGMMIFGFGAIGLSMRSRQRKVGVGFN